VVESPEPKKAPARKAPAKKAAPGKAPVKRAPRKSVAAAAASGDRRQLLVALRNRIGSAIDDPGTPPTALAALIRRAELIAKEIEVIDQASETSAAGAGDWLTAIRNGPASEPWDESAI
jgi:hypothetical protein